jgi:NAD(P)-dependent dehydrogenase (short-subunit alcohol dehydrogenase family)
MASLKRSAVVISASSDIGTAMCMRWKAQGWDVCGTFRTESKATAELAGRGINLVYCDLSEDTSIKDACGQLIEICQRWDVLVLCPGAQEPVGPFAEGSFKEWEKSLKVNFSSQLDIVHQLLPARGKKGKLEPIVLFFAGGGTNNATVNYSAYTISKIALIKMTELLDAEIPDTRFAIVGPGWVKTKIHEATLKAGDKAGGNYRRTQEKLAGGECTPMDTVLDCCDWVINTPRSAVSGRNFSVVFDKWGDAELEKALEANQDMYKLRRQGNDWRKKEQS